MKFDRSTPVVFENASFHTVDELRPRADWMVVLGDRIQRLGSGPAPDMPQRINLNGATVVPGFVDSHIHFFQTGIDSLFVDLSGASSLGELEARLHSSTLGRRSWIFAHSFQEDVLTDADRLTRQQLDAWFADRPAWVGRIDYHSAVVNSSALRRLEIPKGTRGLLIDGGEPNGILRSEAFMHARQRIARLYPIEMREKAVKAGAQLCVSRGTTAIHALEGGPLFGDEGVSTVLKNQPKLPLDITLFLQEKNPVFTKKLGFEHLGGCILIDGSIGSYTAALHGDYAGAAGSSGVLYESARDLRSFVTEAHESGVQLAFHAIGPRAIDQLLDAYERALSRYPRFDHRHRIEHFELATDEQIMRTRDLGLVVAMQPAFEHFWGGPNKMYASRLGDDWRRTNRLRDIVDRGVIIAGGSDANVTPPDPLLGIHAAVNHPNEAQRLTVAEALRMMTVDAAYAAFNERRHGSLSRGKEANFAVLGSDLLSVSTDAIRDITVDQTWYLGRCVYSRT